MATVIDGLQGPRPAAGRARPRPGHRQALRRRRRHRVRQRRRRLHHRPGHHRDQPARLRADRPGAVRARGRPPRVGSVMPSFSSVDWTEDGVGNPLKMHAHRELITGVLKGKLGFDGFVISDWEGDPPDPRRLRHRGPHRRQRRHRHVHGALQLPGLRDHPAGRGAAGRVTQDRVDDAVRRILTKKFELGLFERPFTDRTHLAEVGSAAHRALARRAAAKSQVLLKNRARCCRCPATSGSTSPAATPTTSATRPAAGRSAWQGLSGDIIPGTTILEGIRQVAPDARVTFSEDASAPTAGNDVGIVVVGETPYAEGFGDVGGPQWQDNGVPREPKTMRLNDADRAAVDRVCGSIECVVVVVSGRPHGPDRPARQDGRPGGVLAARQPGRRRRRRPVRPPPVHRQAVHDLAAHPGPGADQRRRPPATTRCSPTAGDCAPGADPGRRTARAGRRPAGRWGGP